jgi:hypothetical protein
MIESSHSEHVKNVIGQVGAESRSEWLEEAEGDPPIERPNKMRTGRGNEWAKASGPKGNVKKSVRVHAREFECECPLVQLCIRASQLLETTANDSPSLGVLVILLAATAVRADQCVTATDGKT